MDIYYEAGGRFMDTANCYASWEKGASGGESEMVIGAWLAERGNRNEMFIATKVGFPYKGVKGGLKAVQIADECDKSLKRLGVESIDLYFAHRDEPKIPLEESLEAFNMLAKSGKVKYFGLSNYGTERLKEAKRIINDLGLTDFCCVENHYTYLKSKNKTDSATQRFFPHMEAIDDEQLTYAKTNHLTLTAYHVMLWGAYVGADISWWGKYASAANEARIEAIKKVAKELEATPNQVVWAWLLASDPPVLPITGPSNPAHLNENLEATDIVLNREQMEFLDRA